jgi:hypothetical protein
LLVTVQKLVKICKFSRIFQTKKKKKFAENLPDSVTGGGSTEDVVTTIAVTKTERNRKELFII